jgi:hypothetical protein
MKRKAYENCLPWEGSSPSSARSHRRSLGALVVRSTSTRSKFIVHMDRE